MIDFWLLRLSFCRHRPKRKLCLIFGANHNHTEEAENPTNSVKNLAFRSRMLVFGQKLDTSYCHFLTGITIFRAAKYQDCPE